MESGSQSSSNSGFSLPDIRSSKIKPRVNISPFSDVQTLEQASKMAREIVHNLDENDYINLRVGDFDIQFQSEKFVGDYGQDVIEYGYTIKIQEAPQKYRAVFRMDQDPDKGVVEKGKFNNFNYSLIFRYDPTHEFIQRSEDQGSTLAKKIQYEISKPENFQFIEDLFMTEYELCQERAEKNISFDNVSNSKKLFKQIDDLLDQPFEEILGIQNKTLKAKRYSGKLGKAFLYCKTGLEFLKGCIAQKKIVSRYAEKEMSAYLSTDLKFMLAMFHTFIGKNLENCYIDGQTLETQPSFHEAVIVQAHEQHHFYADQLLENAFKEDKYSLYNTKEVVEGGARHFQVLMNEHLADTTGDERFRYAGREMVLWDLAGLYFSLCKKHDKTPIVSNDKVDELTTQFLGRKVEEKSIIFANEYATGYVMFKLAEKKHSPAEIHQSVLNNNASVLLDS